MIVQCAERLAGEPTYIDIVLRYCIQWSAKHIGEEGPSKLSIQGYE